MQTNATWGIGWLREGDAVYSIHSHSRVGNANLTAGKGNFVQIETGIIAVLPYIDTVYFGCRKRKQAHSHEHGRYQFECFHRKSPLLKFLKRGRG